MGIEVDASTETDSEEYGVLAQAEAHAQLHGIITAVRRAGSSRRFFDLVDPTGSIQLAVDKDTVGDAAWGTVLSIKKGDRVYVEGTIAPQSRKGQPTIKLIGPPNSAAPLSGTLADIQPDYRVVGTRLFTSRIKSSIESSLDSHRYIRIDVKVISASWKDQYGVGPLRVVYPGFGVPVYLAPSPGPQLVDALIATGEDRVYASATSFMSGYRTALDGVESAIVVAKTLNLPLEDLLQHGTDILLAVVEALGIDDYSMAPPNIEYEWRQTENPELLEVDKQCQIFRGPPAEHYGDASVDVFRIVLKPGVVPIEGVIEQSDEGIPLGTLSIYPERLLPLVEHLPIRRLEHLGKTADIGG